LGAENVLAGMVRAAAPSDADASVPSDARLLAVDVGPLVLHAVGDREAGPAHVVVRADDIVVERPVVERPVAGAPARATSARNVFTARVTQRAGVGAVTEVTLDVSGVPLVAALTTRSAEELGLAE